MQLFKMRCREILNDDPQRKNVDSKMQASSANSELEEAMMEDVAYDGDAIDIVTAYRQLKLDMQKNIKGLNGGREVINGKGYLKPTMSSAQQKFRDKPSIPYNLRMGLSDNALPQIRGHTAPTGVGRNNYKNNSKS